MVSELYLNRAIFLNKKICGGKSVLVKGKKTHGFTQLKFTSQSCKAQSIGGEEQEGGVKLSAVHSYSGTQGDGSSVIFSVCFQGCSGCPHQLENGRRQSRRFSWTRPVRALFAFSYILPVRTQPHG